MIKGQFEIIMIINATITQIAVTFFAFFCKFTIDNTRPLAIIFSHQNKRPSPIKGPLLKIRLQDPLNVLRENSSPVHYWCAYGMSSPIELKINHCKETLDYVVVLL